MKQKYLIIMASLMMLTGTAKAQMMAPVEKANYPFELTTDAANPVLYYIWNGRDSQGGTAPTYVFANEVPWGGTEYKLQIVRQDPRIFANQLWYFVEEGDGVKIVSAEDGRMITVPGTTDAAKCVYMKATDELASTDSYIWKLDNANGCYAFRTADDKTFLSHNGNWQSAGPQMGLYNADGSKDEGSRVFFEALPKEKYPAGIEHTVAPFVEDAIYTITGQRIDNITAPGIYIIGGKKRIVR